MAFEAESVSIEMGVEEWPKAGPSAGGPGVVDGVELVEMRSRSAPSSWLPIDDC